MKKDLIVVMPVYNEAAALESVIKKWVQSLNSLKIDYAIHVYNDGSKDQTQERLDAVAKNMPGLVVPHHKPNSGHGPTILLGYRENASKAEWLFQIDSDDEIGPEAFASFWTARQNADLVIGYREGRNSPLARKIITFTAYLIIRLLYGSGIKDANAPFRLMRSSLFEPVFQTISATTFAPNVIIAGVAAARKMRIINLPVKYQYRTTGEVSIKKWKLFKSAVKSMQQTIGFRLHGQK